MQRRTALPLALIIFSAISLVLKENYPISHFPMYGNPSDDVYYHWLADSEGKALPIAQLTHKTAAKLGKMLRSYTEDRAKELKLKNRAALPPAEVAAICARLLTFLRQEAAAVKQTLPERLSIMRTDIHYTEGRLSEQSRVVYAE